MLCTLDIRELYTQAHLLFMVKLPGCAPQTNSGEFRFALSRFLERWGKGKKKRKEKEMEEGKEKGRKGKGAGGKKRKRKKRREKKEKKKRSKTRLWRKRKKGPCTHSGVFGTQKNLLEGRVLCRPSWERSRMPSSHRRF